MHSINLRPDGYETPMATAEVVPMPEGDLVIGVRPFGAHPDSEYAIVSIRVETDGMLLILVSDGDGSDLIPDYIRVTPPVTA